MNKSATQGPGICQLTSVHDLGDERILHRMAWTVSQMGFRSQVAGPGKESSESGDIALVAVYNPSSPGWFNNRIFAWIRMTWWALRSDFRIFQFHDPDLIPTGLILRLFCRKVIYDVHDDYQASFETRLAKRPILLSWFPKAWWLFERTSARLLNGIIVADRHLASKFAKCAPITLGNFPSRGFTQPSEHSRESTFNLIYVGGVTRDRGLSVLAKVLKQLPHQDIRLHVVGTCRDEQLLEELSSDPRIVIHGRVEWEMLGAHYAKSHVGMAIYQPLPCFTYCTGENAVKIVEYMAAGIPVITSNFPGLVEFVQDGGFGMVVDPTDLSELTAKIEELYFDRDSCERLGVRGRELFEAEYNWENHQEKLKNLYRSIASLGDQAP